MTSFAIAWSDFSRGNHSRRTSEIRYSLEAHEYIVDLVDIRSYLAGEMSLLVYQTRHVKCQFVLYSEAKGSANGTGPKRTRQQEPDTGNELRENPSINEHTYEKIDASACGNDANNIDTEGRSNKYVSN
jgi:hypothetical protein